MPVVLVAKDDVPLDDVRHHLTVEGAEAVQCLDTDALLSGKCAAANSDLIVLVSTNQHFIETGEIISRIRQRLGDCQSLMLCVPRSDNRQLLLAQGADEVISPAGVTPERLAERILAQLILARRIVPYSFCEELLWGATRQMRETYEKIQRFAQSKKSVLILGETGTGKGLVAAALHNQSKRSGKYVEINIPTISADLIESELFGHLKGSFTHALNNRIGLIEDADQGTAFIDEIGDLHQAAQVKLLDVVERGRVRRVGTNVFTNVSTRLVFATNQDLQKFVDENRFRLDLFQRINVLNMTLSPLRERMADIPLLVEHFKRKYEEDEQQVVSIEPDANDALFCHSWPGNLRELESTVYRAATIATISGASEPITYNTFAGAISGRKARPAANDIHTHTQEVLYFDPAKETLHALQDRVQAAYFISLLRKTGGNKKRAIEKLGMSRDSFYAIQRKLRQAGLLPPDIDSHDE